MAWYNDWSDFKHNAWDNLSYLNPLSAQFTGALRGLGVDKEKAEHLGSTALSVPFAAGAAYLGGSALGGGAAEAGAEEYPLASADTLNGWGLGGAEYGGYEPTAYASSVSDATGGALDYKSILQKALKSQGSGQGGGSVQRSHPENTFDFGVIQPQMLDPVMKQRALVQALLGSGNG